MNEWLEFRRQLLDSSWRNVEKLRREWQMDEYFQVRRLKLKMMELW